MMKVQIIGLFLFCFSFSQAAEVRYECPKEMKLEEKVAKAQTPQGWQVKQDFSPKQHQLENLSVYDGPPEQGARLVPDSEENTQASKTIWTFGAKKERSIWLGCEYRNSNLIFAKELPKGVTSCRLLVNPPKSLTEVAGVACQ